MVFSRMDRYVAFGTKIDTDTFQQNETSPCHPAKKGKGRT
ncbi:hypothetical protein FTV88_1376 [Heliorestis convoluta]|uniref:Uncharacterized protein n=1 Tax=Heliorestis convoluta TaxID=356322 RepID=A0A5Q2N147_9FIRM|nr:hypothetical protein FTV88_1376 [Heliorestis convoluta]